MHCAWFIHRMTHSCGELASSCGVASQRASGAGGGSAGRRIPKCAGEDRCVGARRASRSAEAAGYTPGKVLEQDRRRRPSATSALSQPTPRNMRTHDAHRQGGQHSPSCPGSIPSGRTASRRYPPHRAVQALPARPARRHPRPPSFRRQGMSRCLPAGEAHGHMATVATPVAYSSRIQHPSADSRSGPAARRKLAALISREISRTPGAAAGRRNQPIDVCRLMIQGAQAGAHQCPRACQWGCSGIMRRMLSSHQRPAPNSMSATRASSASIATSLSPGSLRCADARLPWVLHRCRIGGRPIAAFRYTTGCALLTCIKDKPSRLHCVRHARSHQDDAGVRI